MVKIDLYLAKDMDALSNLFENVNSAVKGKTVTQILSSAKKLVAVGDESYNKGDEENAYVMYGRYFNAIVALQKRPDYKKQKDYINKATGGNKEVMKCMDRLESLKQSLSSRYEEKQMHESFNAFVPSEVPAINVSMELKESRQSISCLDLFQMMEHEPSKFIILDCRPELDFQQSRIKFNFICNVPENLCSVGMSEGKVKEGLPNESKVFWEMRKDRPLLIFVDWASTSFIRNSPIWYLKSTLTEWDEDCNKKPEIILLEGGYDRWLTTYPMKCTDPHVQRPTENVISAPSMDGIEYPNIEDIEMKDVSKRTPTVDRSTKSIAMKNYELTLSPKELLEKKEQLLNESVQNDKELIKLEADYTELVSNKENEEDESTSQNVLYKILQLQTKQKDNEFESETIDEVIKAAKKDPVKPLEMSKLEDIENRLKQKADESRKTKEELSKRQTVLDEALKKARENKPNFVKTPVKTPRKSEIVLSPRNLNTPNSLPHFDRASKPSTNGNQQAFYDNQEFNPVYGQVQERGLTGLKNLGNTCYMNSILQCLSHTLSLKQFIMEGSYEKYINKTNTTKGHVIRALAALVKMLWRGDCKYISGKHLKAVIGDMDQIFYGCDQQDAHEFLIMLIDWLQSDLQTIHMSSATTGDNASEKAWLEYTKAKESFILRIFYGQIKSTLKCTVCGEESATFDTFSNLSLELPPVEIDRDHLNQCFNSYFHGEKISGWNCPKCKVPRDAVKKLDISKLPPILIIHLKRFYTDSYFNSRKKTAYVDFPLTNLDMLPYVAPKERANIAATSRPYNLYAVSNHYGTLESGHYTAFCLNAKQKKWYKFDDQHVTSMDRNDVKSSAAYVLFYTTLTDTNYIN